jgi:Tol biopolymer transport system component
MLAQIISLAVLLTFQSAQPAKISKVAFARGGFVYVKDFKTGIEKRIAKGSYPSISPDGTRVAFSVDGVTSNKDMSREIRLVDLATGRVTEFDSLKKYLCYGTVWSPDSKMLAFGLYQSGKWQAVVLDVETREWRIVSQKINTSLGVSATTWSADSKSILTQDLDNVYQVKLDSAVVRKFPVSEIADDISYVSSATTYVLAPDGNSLIFDTEELPGESRRSRIWEFDLRSKTRKQISPPSIAASGPSLLPSGEEIVFTGVLLARRRGLPAIYRMRRDGTRAELLVANADQGSVAIEK